MKIKEALDIISGTRTVRAKFEDSRLTFIVKDKLVGGNWGFWFMRMNEAARNWNSIGFEPAYLSGVSSQDLARTMDVVQRLIDTPLDERKPKKKHRLRWLDSTDPFLRATTYLGRVVDNELGNYYWSTFPDYSAELFTEDQLKKMKRDNPKLAPAIDAMKEEVKDDD